MRKTLMIGAVSVALLVPGLAVAQEGTAAGVAGGAATGAVLGGPVGAVVGGIAGGVLGTAIDPPPPAVRTYVVEERRPSVVYEGQVAVGEPLPDQVVLYEVPRYEKYRFAVVNERHVIVDPRTRKIIEVVN